MVTASYQTLRQPRISALTAALSPREDYLKELYASLCAQDVAWEWVVQEDGPADAVRVPAMKWLNSDSRVRAGVNGEQLGISATRNRGLMRARSELIYTVDADDVLFEGALIGLLSALDAHPDAALAFGRVRDLHADGSLHSWGGRPDPRFTPGLLAAGAVFADWDQQPVACVYPTAVLWRRAHLIAMGGWPALSANEDHGLLMSISELFPCVYADLPTTKYRQHEQQTVNSSAYTAGKYENIRFTTERVAAQRALGLTAGPLAR